MSQRVWRIDLLPRDMLIKTGPVDEGDWHYRPLLRTVMQKRVGLLIQLLRSQKFPRLLDLGYGSGILMPELTKHCDTLHGLDIHAHHREVQQRLATAGVVATLTRGSAETMPYESNFFDAVVAMSSLEFIDNIEAALLEISRVLVPGGSLIFISPEKTAWGDRLLRWVTGTDGDRVFRGRRERLRAAVPHYFDVAHELTYSPMPRLFPPIYRACHAHPRILVGPQSAPKMSIPSGSPPLQRDSA